MPVYEFECIKSHITSDLVPIGQKAVLCAVCLAEQIAMGERNPEAVFCWNPVANRILSPTPTTFEFADKRRR